MSNSGLSRFCVFCGNKPKKKNREHIIPQWLIALTGDPKRQVYLGRKWLDEKLTRRDYSFAAFTFPACESCNYSFSSLESGAYKIVVKILADEQVESAEFDLLLDWLDKVRVGLWLAMLYVNNNYRGIKPLFHIASRIAQKDRMLCIYKINDNDKGLTLSAVDTPIFHHSPSCFGISINNRYFFNASYDFLLSKNMGFPYPQYTKMIPGRDQLQLSFEDGLKSITLPVSPIPVIEGSTEIYQPMISREFLQSDAHKHYDNDYVRKHCRDFNLGRGHIYQRTASGLELYSTSASSAWIPSRSFSRAEIFGEIDLQAGEWQEYLWKQTPDLSELDDSRRNEVQANITGVLKLHSIMMDHRRKQMSQ